MVWTDRFRAPAVSVNARPQLRRRPLSILLAAACCCLTLAPTTALAQRSGGGSIEVETKSAYSHIRVRRSGSVRSLIFVRDSGEEAYESQVNLKTPYVLRFSYLQHMFANYLFQPEQQDAIIVGLGGGSMIHFLQKYDPQVNIEAVEIDPVVVELAERYFAVKQKKNVRLVIADAFDYLKKTTKKYDTIYMDAFLKPSANTDETGVPLKLRTQAFYQQLQGLLKPGGSVVFNINPHPQLRADIETISESFPQTYVFSLPNSEGVVVVGSMQTDRLTAAQLSAAGKSLDKRFKCGFSFDDIAKRLRKQ